MLLFYYSDIENPTNTSIEYHYSVPTIQIVKYVVRIIRDNTDLDSHPVQVHHAPGLGGQTAGSHSLVQTVDKVVKVTITLPDHSYSVALGELVQVKLAVLPPGAHE